MQRLVSIITPTYNHKGFIGPSIASVLGQTYPDWEMIIVDDGSTDGTADIARRFAKKDERIKVFPRENVGIFRLAETYNFGLAQSSGELVAVLEGDDVWEPNKLELQVKALESNPDTVLSWGNVVIASANLDPIGLSLSDDVDRDRSAFDNRPVGVLLNQMYLENIISAVTMVIRRNELEAIGGFQYRDRLPLVDYPTILSLVVRGPFAYVGETLAHWRWHPNQVTKSYHPQIIERVRDLALEHFDGLDDLLRREVRLTRAEKEAGYRHAVQNSYVQSGRYKLAQKRFGEARSDYFRALFFPGLTGPTNRLVALAGIASSLGGMDLEWLARLLGKKPIA
ncbi:MAG: glycosyltransferase family 2 protein [Rhodothermia bacterium]